MKNTSLQAFYDVQRARLSRGWFTDVMCDEHGMTAIGMAVALLLSLALLFTTAQVYELSTASAQIQEVADAAVLAAENSVAEFMIAVRLCDGAVLTLTLLAICAYGLGVAALCTPFTASLSAELIDFGARVMETRNTFAQRAADGLNTLSRVLPFIAAAHGAMVAHANNEYSRGANYFAVAILVPQQGEPITVGACDEATDLATRVESDADSIRDQSAEAEQAAVAADKAKQRGFNHDCGYNPDYCMYERASHLASLSGSRNQLYHSVDTWSFSVALARAQTYYRARYDAEAIDPTTNIETQADSVLRKRFYRYAIEQLNRGYVRESEDSFEAYFPLLFRNTEQMRSTPLYTEAAYPVTVEDDTSIMHAFTGCPASAGYTRFGSIRELDEGEYETCSACQFRPSSLGNIASASTSIQNGFEYHYAAVAQAAADYQRARATLDPLTRSVKHDVKQLFDACVHAIKSAASMRIDAHPPGRYGAIALVVALGDSAASDGFSSSFVHASSALGARAAVSASTLLADEAHDNATLITSLLDSFGQTSNVVVGAGRILLSCWSGLLSVYGNGQQALINSVRSALNLLPLPGASGLGDWAAGKLEEAIASVGLEPARLDALKPVLVNTGHVSQAGSDTFAVTYTQVKERAVMLSSSSTSIFDALVDVADDHLSGMVQSLEDGIVVATIDFPLGGGSLPIKITLPEPIIGGLSGFVDSCVQTLRSIVGAVTQERVWQ